MQSLTRRFLLSGAVVAPVATLIPAGFALATPAATEIPELLALGEQIAPLLTTYRDAVERHRAARATAEASCPAVPNEIVCKGPQWAGCTERERDVEGKDIWPADYVGADGNTYARAPRNILNAAHTKASIARGNLYCDRRTQFGKQLSKLIETAERHEAERTAAIEQSGIQNAADKLQWAATDLDELAYKIRDFAPVTMAGVMIQARALAAHSEAELIVHGHGRAAAVLGRQLADAVLRIASGSAVQS